MARKSEAIAPSPEAREHVLSVLRTTPAPVTARDLTKQLAPPHTLSEKALTPVLDEFVTAGMAYRLSGKTAKAKPRYWHQDVADLGREALRACLQSLDEALSAKEIAQRLTTPIEFREADVIPLLESFVASGELYAHPAATGKGKPKFSHLSAPELGRQQMLRTLETKGPQPWAALRKVLKSWSDDQAQEIVQQLEAERKLWRHPPTGKGKAAKELLATRPPSPEPYLHDLARELSAVVPKLLTAGVSKDDLRRALVQLCEASGVTFSRSEGPASATGVDLLALMKRLEPGAERGALVSARELRQAARLEKALFDRTVLDLARQGRLALHRHDYPTSLSFPERDELVTDGQGAYYVGMALRQS